MELMGISEFMEVISTVTDLTAKIFQVRFGSIYSKTICILAFHFQSE